jgi:cell division protein FtsN
MRVAILSLAASLSLCATILAQTSTTDINKYLLMIENGQVEQVRQELPSLLSRHPNDPGILYIQGMATSDGAEAVRTYQSVVDNFPKSDWADDALYKVYQFYYAIGLYRTAEIKLTQLKANYPNSKYVTQAAEVQTKSLTEEKQPVVNDTTVQETEEAKDASEPAKIEAPKSQFTLQVGAYTAQVNAEKQKLFFEDLGLSVEVVSKVKQNRSLYIVLVGGYATYDEAKAKGAEFKKKYNIDSIVVSR